MSQSFMFLRIQRLRSIRLKNKSVPFICPLSQSSMSPFLPFYVPFSPFLLFLYLTLLCYYVLIKEVVENDSSGMFIYMSYK